ncbi:hypothetical protein AAG570_000040 [Ranatra chinensis]|uniref:RNA-directed DNA polymerase n=1 Tax=Ranatra chinensis TaxID=642074 RepID=A0ABD0ZH39_9HEMI
MEDIQQLMGQQLMGQQAMMAALATLQGVTSSAETHAVQKANMLMLHALNIPEFDGENAMPSDFIKQGGCLMAQIEGWGLDETSKLAIRQMLVGRVSVAVRRELGVSMSVDWNEFTRKLKEGYGGARKPYQKQVVSLLRTNRQKGESSTSFAQSIEARTQVISERIMESEEDWDKAQVTIEVVKSLVVEHVRREMPERVRTTLKNPSKPLRLDEVVDIIKEEDEDFKDERRNEKGWTRVSKHPPRRQEYRPQREYRLVLSTNNKKWTPREDKPSNGNRRYEQDGRDSRRCYQCRERGHIARFCPYVRRPSGFRERGTSSGSSGEDRTYLSSDEEGRKSSGDRASRSGDDKWQKKKVTYSAAAQQGKNIRDLGKVKRRLQEFGLKISANKSSFFLQEVKFMGHIVSKQGTRPDPGKVQAVRDLPEPTNLKGLRSFLGMVNFYRRFIREFADKLEPMTKLLKKNVKFHFNEKAKEVFNRCKNALSTVPILQFPDFGKKIILTTDASQVAVGAVLAQDRGEGEKPIAFASKKLTPTETRYSTIERELLGIVWAVKTFRPYLLGRKFTIKPDHKTMMEGDLAAYEFEIVHTRGSENVVADRLSRQVNALETEEVDSEYAGRFLETWLGEVTDGDGVGTRSQRYGRTTTVRVIVGRDITDDNIKETLEQLTEDGKVYHLHVTNESLKEKIKRWYVEMTTTPNVTMVKCTRQVETIENEERQRQIIRRYHEGHTNHRGIKKTLPQLKRIYYWNDMQRTIGQTIEDCKTCNESKYERHPAILPQQLTNTATVPLEEVQADLCVWEGMRVLTMLDMATKFLFAKCVIRKTGQAVKEGILEFCGTVGIPKTLTTDPGTGFSNRLVRTVIDELDIQMHTTTPGHHQSHGAIERLHSTMAEHMRLWDTGEGIKGPEAVARTVLAYKESVHSATRKTPTELMRARKRADNRVAIERELENIGPSSMRERSDWRTAIHHGLQPTQDHNRAIRNQPQAHPSAQAKVIPDAADAPSEFAGGQTSKRTS